MPRDSKSLRRNSGRNNSTEEAENLPQTLNPRDYSNPKIITDPSRPPLNTIPEPSRIPKTTSDHDLSGFKPSKFNRTPTKPKHTPDKQGTLSKKRVNWAQKGEHSSTNNLSSNGNTPSSARANVSYAECYSAQTTPTKSVSKPPNAGFSSSSGSRPVPKMGARMMSLSKGIPGSCNLPAVVNTVEAPCFELKEDPSFWIEHNVQVLIRVRPLNNMEKSSFGYSRCLKQESGQSITWIGQPETRFMYDHVACEAIDQEALFGMVGLPMVENCLSGYNSCMFAYGQTGSGKTHTMLGEIEALEVKPSPNRGMTPRIFEFLFARIREEEEIRRGEHLKYNCKCSFLEIYNEQITDLLDPSSTNLMLREDMKKGVYVENLSEFEVHTVGDILQLLTQGASNRKVAATNMNRESSRSHSVFTCVIESTWEKDSVSNFRFARLNLVDLAGSERQKSSGAEGERLKEAANINKSLSTLGHVIMVLVDVANGKPRHIPYRDSRLTFLLQDSLGGNSKTMIIANVSPSICSAAETLNTLKFAQRAKLIQNNAVINEDSSGDVVALKHQIQLLKEELSALKREKVTRTLSFGESCIDTSIKEEDNDCSEQTHVKENGFLRVPCEQLRSLESTLAGALRREQMAETTVRQLQAEIHQLNRLVSQREEDTRCRKMMLKFREDKIQRMESVLGGIMPMDDYLVRENKALSEENQLLRERVDKNPEVTRFAVENIRLLDQVRQFQDLYEEGEKEMLMNEVCELRNQLISSLDENLKQPNHLDIEGSNSNDSENNLLHEELKITLSELEGSKKKLNCFLEENATLQREIEELRASLSATTQETDSSAEVLKESIVGVPMVKNSSITTTLREKEGTRSESHVNVEDIMYLQLELDIVKIILQEQRSAHVETAEMAKSLNRELQLSKETVISLNKDYERVLEELKNAKYDIEVEAETSEVIIHLQKELAGLQQEVYYSKAKETETSERLVLLETMRAEWDVIACEMEHILSGGDESLRDVSDQIDVISVSIPNKTSLVSENFGKVKKYIFQKEVLIEELSRCLKEALKKSDDMECMLKSLRGAALVMTQAHQQECCEKNKEILRMTSEISSKTSTVEELQGLIEHGRDQLKTASSCATAAFVVVNRLWESNCNYRDLVIDVAENEGNNNILETREKLKELNSGVSEIKLNINDYVKIGGCKLSRTGTRIEEDTDDINSVNLASERAVNSVNGRDDSIILLKKEIEFGLKRLQELQVEMDKLRFEKEEVLASEKTGRKRIDSTINQVVILEDAIENFRGEFEIKVDGLERKIEKLEEIIHQSFASWVLLRDLLEDELGGAIVIAAQKTIEASCIVEKFEEVQDNVKEADVMINELMMANEALKLNAHESKARENNLTGERDVLAKEVKSLEKQYGSDFDIMTRAVSELENVISEIQMATVKEWTSVFPDFFTMKSQFQESTTLIKIMLEEVWSEIIAKDCTMSVLHLCHMGILLDTANGLHTENNLLEHGLCKSNSVVSELREHNLKSRNELEMCIVLKGKLLADITRGFNQISSKVDENGEVSLKLASFEKNIQNLQFQEEMLLERSNDMVSELEVIMKELDLCNKYTVASIMDYESLLKEKDGLIQNQEESFVIELLAKDFELLVLSSELKQVALLKEDAEKAHLSTYGLLENLKKDVVFKSLETASCELLLLEKENRYEKLLRDFKTNELALETSSSHISELYQKIRKLQNELELKHGEFGKLSCLEKENEELQVRLNKSKAGYSLVLQEFEDRKAALDIENQELRDSMAKLEEDLRLAKLKIENHEVSQCIVKDGLQNQLENVNTLKTENTLLRNELRVYEGNQSEYLNCLNLKMLKNLDLAENVDKASLRIINLIEKKLVEVEDKFQSIVNEMDNTNELLDQFECMGNIALKLDSETSRKDDILKGVLFDLSLLQESASNSKDQKDEMKEVLHSVSILKRDYELKSSELEKAVAEGQSLEARLQEKMEHISVLELELSRGQEVINSLSSKNAEVLDGAKEAFDAKNSMEKEFLEARIKIEDLEMVLGQMSKTIDSLKCDTDSVTCQRDDLCSKVLILSKELETARALAQENAEIAIEAKEKAEIQKVDAEEKEEEVRLLERSIEELEFTINVLEQKVDIVKGEAERQRRQRGELELELLGFKEQMQNIKINDSDLKRCLDEKEMNHKESLLRVKLLEKEIAARDTEISRCKAHICELNLHAEAQASEHKQRFKALEAMVEKLKYEVSTTHSTSSPKKLEKIPSKFKGSGSPFKCIGLGIVQQIRSEKDEELTAGRQRIEELEDLATSRQKEILMLRARLASTESMTHDVIRDLLGVKLNMKNYGNLMDNQQLHSLMGKTQHHNFDDNVKNQDVSNLKLQINEFVKERNGWLEEIERKQAKMMSAHVALEKLRQQEQLLATENEMLKLENAKHRKKVMGLEDEVTNLSGQQNIQQRIHHHAKTKEENNSLKFHNEELRFKLRRTESILSRVKDELAQFRAANGKNPYINFDMEEQLDMKLKETEEEKVQLAQKLLGLCTTVLKAAGITKPTSEISISVAEVVLVQLKNRVVSLEMELEDVKLKNRISDERTRLLELQPQTSTESSSSSDMVRNRASQTPFLSSLDR